MSKQASSLMNLEGLKHRNGSRNHRWIMRDMDRGKISRQFGARYRIVEPVSNEALERAIDLLDEAVQKMLER